MKKPKKSKKRKAMPKFSLRQRTLMAHWAFPVSKLEEFLALFHRESLKLIAKRMSCVDPMDNPKGENHPLDARVFAQGLEYAIRSAEWYKSSPEYCEVDYFFWIINGIVCFGYVLPSTEKIDHPTSVNWVRFPIEYKVNGKRLSIRPEGVIPVYVKMLSFKSGQMVGVNELANLMVKNPKERNWAIQHVLWKWHFKKKVNRVNDVAQAPV